MTPTKDETESASRKITSTSRSLLARLRDDDADAWDRLVSLYAPMVYFWCRKQQLPNQDMPDVVQEVFKSVAANIASFRKERAKDTFRGWLRTITRSKVADYYRHQQDRPKAAGGTVALRRLSQVPAEPKHDEPEDEQVEGELFLRAMEIIQRDFQEHTFQAFWRTVVDGKAPKDVAEELSMSPGAVRIAKSRVLHRLRQGLGELLE